VLPRWGINSPIRDHGADPGQYTGTVGWTSREHYLAFTVPTAIKMRPDALTAHHVDPETFRRWVSAKSLYAQDRRSGRRVIVRPQTIRDLLQCSLSTVHRCQRAARDLGLEVVITPGRMLSDFEAYKARKSGSPQRGLSTVSAFVVPSWIERPVDHDTPSSGLSISTSVTECSAFDKRCARPKGAPLRSAPPKRRRSSPRGPAWTLAQGLTEQVIFLKGCPAGRIAGQLNRFTQPGLPRWTPTRLQRAIDAVNRRLGYNCPTASKVAPWGILAWYLRQIDPVADHPGLDQPLIPDTPPWCGACHSDTYRWTVTPDDQQPVRPCPHCSPQAGGSHRTGR